jgi:mono/diheme cytochrome c family protein
MSTNPKITWLAGAALLGGLALATPAWAQSRGELLYQTHCIACHTTKQHWRDNRVATDWASLLALVRHWQADAMLGWSDDDILAVTRHLNASYYRFTAPSGPIGSLQPPPPSVRRPAAAAGRASGLG